MHTYVKLSSKYRIYIFTEYHVFSFSFISLWHSASSRPEAESLSAFHWGAVPYEVAQRVTIPSYSQVWYSAKKGDHKRRAQQGVRILGSPQTLLRLKELQGPSGARHRLERPPVPCCSFSFLLKAGGGG